MAGSETASIQVSNPVLTRKLASTDKKTRDKAVALFTLWLSCQQEVDEESLKKVWKGLFYCMWHADKAPVQAELVENLAGLLEKADVDVSITFFKVFLSTMRREWAGIDKLRLDKFYLLLRRFLSYMFKVLDSRGWDHALTVKFMEALEERAFLATDRFAALGINLHFTDVYWDEFRKFLPAPRGILELLLKPFFSLLSNSTDKPVLKRVRENIFDPLLQDGRTFSEDIEVEGSEKKASTFGYLLHSTPIVTRLFDLASSSSTPQANRKMLYELHEEFSKVAKLLEAIDGAVYESHFQEKESKILGNAAGQTVQVVPGEEIEDGGRISKSRLKRKQARALALGVRDPVSFKSKKADKSRKALSKKNHEGGRPGIGNGDYHVSEVGGDVVVIEDEAPTKKTRGAKGILGMNIPLLQKRMAKRKEKRKKKDPIAVVAEVITEGNAPAAESVIAQRSVCVVGVKENGHQSINDVTMNLEKQFDCVASEGQGRAPKNSDPPPPLDASCETRSKKKRKKSQSAIPAVPEVDDTSNCVQNSDGPTLVKTEDGNEGSMKKSKKVRFALRNNIVWKPQGPLPPLSVRTPPSATPRGSALKVGVPPGPIRTRPIRATRGTGMKSRKRVSKQYISVSSQKPARTSPRKVRRQSL